MKKKHQVAMLPTEESVIGYRNGSLIYREGEPFLSDLGNTNPQHLYILSDAPIKEGDWILEKGYIINQYPDYLTDIDECKKIIATTDRLLMDVSTYGESMVSPVYLPQLSRDFIKEYCKRGGVGEIEVEYTYNHPVHELPLKLNPDNTINTSFIEDKMYTREDAIKLVKAAFYLGHTACSSDDANSFTAWRERGGQFIKENL